METSQSYETDEGNCSTSLDDNRTFRYANICVLLMFSLDGTQIHYQLCIAIADDDNYIVFDDPMIKEMFQVMKERYPKFNQLKAKEWVKRHPETVVHGDFHSGNHMFGLGENEGENDFINEETLNEFSFAGSVVVFDFQTSGKGLASNDFAQVVNWSYDVKTYEEVDQLARGNNNGMNGFMVQIYETIAGYHRDLCQNGVKDYALEDFLSDVKIAIAEQVVSVLKTANDMKPDTFEKMINNIIGEEKAQDFMKLMEKGLFVKPLLALTTLYVHDKDNFLLVKE